MVKKSGETAVIQKKVPKKNKKGMMPPTAKPIRSSRKLKRPAYKSFRLTKSVKHPVKLPNVWVLTRKTWDVLWRHKMLFAGITLTYGLLNLLLVQGLASNTDVTGLKDTLNQVSTGQWGEVVSGLSIFAVLVSSAGNGSSQTAGAYQLFLGLITSLAVIWTLRQVLSGKVVRIRDAYYRGMYPLVPFILVLVVVGLQLVPLMIGSTLYGLVITNGIAVHAVERLVFGGLFAALAALSLYLVTSSLFALYIVTLPDMTPIRALRSARELVRGRRWLILRKLLFLPFILLAAAAIIMLPIIIFLTPLAQWIFFLLTMFALVAVHAYMYTLYRELLNE